MRCSFCPQDHESRQGISEAEILSKIPFIVHWINKESQSQEIKLHIMGGELFQDFLIEKDYLVIYQKFIDEISKRSNPEKRLIFNFITNLSFKETTKIKKFFDHNQLKFSVSYDSTGRFNTQTLAQFRSNIEYFQKYISMISIVMTKQTINKIVKGDELFDYLYKQFDCHFDEFLPSVPLSDSFIPLDSEKLIFYKLLIDKYPLCLNIEPFLSHEVNNKMTCTRGRSFTIMKDNTIPKECSGSIFLKEGNRIELDTPKIVHDFLEKEQCHSCEYYQQCPFPCFVSEKYSRAKKDLGRCLYKGVFDYAKS